MKRNGSSFQELICCLCFLLYLYGSSLAHIQNGIELSLWLMAFAVAVSSMITLLPWLGFRWLKLPGQGSRAGYGLALSLQICSWGTFAAAMVFRLYRNLPHFHLLITTTTLLWAAWILVFLFSRYAFQQSKTGDTLSPAKRPDQPGKEKIEE